MAEVKLQALVNDILPPTAAIIGYAMDLRKLSVVAVVVIKCFMIGADV